MSDYAGDSIKVMKPMDHLRANPSMYIGSTENPSHLAQEVITNAVDEHLNGFGKLIEVELGENRQSIRISDKGRGIPVENVKSGIPAVTAIFTQLFSGGKFDRNSGYDISAGLHGIGLSAVGALSSKVIVQIARNGKLYQETYSQGAVLTPLQVLADVDYTGTNIYFEPDPEIFESIEFNGEDLKRKLQDLSYMLPGCKLIFRCGDEEKVYESTGLSELLAGRIQTHIQQGKRAEKISDIQYLTGTSGKSGTELAFCFTNDDYLHNFSFCNCLRNIDGGTHETAIKRIFFNVLQKNFPGASSNEYSVDDLQSGVWIAIHLKLAEKLAFTSQTKEKLSSRNAYAVIQESLEQKLIDWVKANQETVKRVYILAQTRYYARKQSAKLNAAASKIKMNLGKMKRGNLEYDCISNQVEDSELFLLEGDSAAGSANQARDIKKQALLPLKGKVPNAFKWTKAAILQNAEFSEFLNALGCGFGENCRPELLRFNRIMILTDSDPDGAHISSLLICFMLMYLRPVVEQGFVHIVDAPLYTAVKGKERLYAHTKDELDDKIDGAKGWVITRFKGWGECNPSILRDIALNPETRKTILLQPNEDSYKRCKEIMGDDSSFRKLLFGDITD
jgi:DNA gyrase/topoisomerase IV subunit B